MNLIIALLEAKGVIEHSEAEKLAKALADSMIPASYGQARITIKNILDKLGKDLQGFK